MLGFAIRSSTRQAVLRLGFGLIFASIGPRPVSGLGIDLEFLRERFWLRLVNVGIVDSQTSPVCATTVRSAKSLVAYVDPHLSVNGAHGQRGRQRI